MKSCKEILYMFFMSNCTHTHTHTILIICAMATACMTTHESFQKAWMKMIGVTGVVCVKMRMYAFVYLCEWINRFRNFLTYPQNFQ